jgi:DNA-binding Lrp family transcriptional regulator
VSQKPSNHVHHDTRRGRTLARVLGIYMRLQQGGRWTLHQLAEEYHVSQRTIRRDLYALEEAGVPLGHNPDSDDDDADTDYTWWLMRGAA